ncbi:MAG TPA: hypothetical protein VHI93_08675 [Candidatus Thermoplasmatota archaeon]|nr:hypothetical protein [Candidatus Thermoplasmatota archaeon]
MAALAAPPAAGHGAPDADLFPNGPFHRVLADHADDCGGHGLASRCQDTNDLVALDVQERHDASRGDLVIFRFTLGDGQAGATLRTTTTFQVGGNARSFSIETTDNVHFVGTGTEAVLDARPLGEGRFQVDALLRRDSLGPAGQRLADFQATATRGSAVGDLMPGTYRTPLGTDGPAPPGDPACGCPRKVDYPLRGPTYYFALSAPAGTQVATAGRSLPIPVQLGLENKLLRGQAVTAAASGADGVTVGFHSGGDGHGATYTPQVVVPLAAQGGTTLHLDLRGERAGASGTLTVTVASDLGGRVQVQVPYVVQEAGAPSPSPSGDGHNHGTSKPAPLPAALAGLALLGAALRRRA